jgi:hypothetical protein
VIVVSEVAVMVRKFEPLSTTASNGQLDATLIVPVPAPEP